MSFNYAKLLGKMRECGYTQEKLAKTLKINKGTLNAKLKNKSNFTALEIKKMSELFKISSAEIGSYFFIQEVRKSGTNQSKVQ